MVFNFPTFSVNLVFPSLSYQYHLFMYTVYSVHSNVTVLFSFFRCRHDIHLYEAVSSTVSHYCLFSKNFSVAWVFVWRYLEIPLPFSTLSEKFHLKILDTFSVGLQVAAYQHHFVASSMNVCDKS